MKNILYYISLIITWLVIIIVLAFILTICGIVPTLYGWGYALGSACGYPQLWVIALGCTLLIRPALYKVIFKEHKEFKKTVPVIIIIIGSLWLAINLGAMIYNRAVEKAVMERVQENDEEIIDYVPGMFDKK